ncbi:hypothetical protein CCM_07804 [Cordyceps militaris CM01]|uniref:Secreted protein n=1 Tax=Cordyceps militaris (strain CM01) TaxID=983644 RepID=G3JQP8_CORMM|nr:uncharacterized protein CCM_07804 [Cordyceps militaris CM01]EGX89552.1 hypothetical protein CCM_07804 [Cordyceps militaris CM01]
MKGLLLVFVALASAVSGDKGNSTGKKMEWETAVYRDYIPNKNHPCLNPRDCQMKCANGSYVRTQIEGSGINQLRCTGANSDYSYLAGLCRLEFGGGIFFKQHRLACEHVNGLYCLPTDPKQVKKNTYLRCIFDRADYAEWKAVCEQGGGLNGGVVAPDKKDIPWNCSPDYMD